MYLKLVSSIVAILFFFSKKLTFDFLAVISFDFFLFLKKSLYSKILLTFKLIVAFFNLILLYLNLSLFTKLVTGSFIIIS